MKENNTLANILFITVDNSKKILGGREQLSNLLFNSLKKIGKAKVFIFRLPQAKKSFFISLVALFNGNVDGINHNSISNIKNIILKNNINIVIIDGSNLGSIIPNIINEYYGIKVFCYFHNVESRFFWGSFRRQLTVRSLGVFIANTIAERSAVKYSDKIICLSIRDSRLLFKIYGRHASYISPMAIEDNLEMKNLDSRSFETNEPYALFVGGNFYANRDGIIWFVNNVAHKIGIKVIVVGKGMEDFRSVIEIPGRVSVIGTVDNLNEWYRNAHFVIAPIFDGSGMKTKIAEALMHGKKVVGTAESFSGYEEVASKIGWCCHDATSFADSIKAAQRFINLPFDPEMRKIYEERYSLEAATLRFAKIFSTSG